MERGEEDNLKKHEGLGDVPGLIRQDILRQHPFFRPSIYTLRKQSSFAFFILDFFEVLCVGFLSLIV